MPPFLLILIILLIVATGVAISFFFIRKEIKGLKEKKEDLALNMIMQKMETMGKRFEDGSRQIAQELGRVQEIGRALRDFQDFLRSPKLRGGVGEQILKDLLAEVLPKSNFQSPYQFREGDVVDAIVKTRQGLIPIDSKFPMESFQRYIKAKNKEKENYLKEFSRDIKKHIDDISRKYILPQEGTLDYAVMYIPVESVFSEIIVNEPELLEYARDKKVLLVSPNTFYYFLKIIMIGLEGAKIEEASKRILEGLRAIQQESLNFGKELGTLTSHIEHAKNASDRVQLRYGKLVSRIDGLRLLEPEKPKEIEESKNN